MEKIDKSKRLLQARWALHELPIMEGKKLYFDSVAEILVARAQEIPNKVYVYYYDDEVTFAQMNERSNKVANYLKEKGVAKGDIVSVMVLNSPETLYSNFGAQKLGAIAGQVNYMLMPPEIAYVLDDSKPKAVFVSSEYMDKFAKGVELAQHKPIVIEVETGVEHDAKLAETTMRKILDQYPADEALTPQSGNDPVLLIYSSGTTGQPKGVLLSNRNVCFENIVMVRGNSFQPGDKFLMLAPMFHVSPLCNYTYPFMYMGQSLVIRKAFSPQDFWPSVMKYGITFVWGTPAMWMYVLNEIDPATIDYDKVKLRVAYAGGAAVPKELFEILNDRFGITLFDGYGLTENSGFGAWTANLPVKYGSIGHGIPGEMDLEIMDENNNILPYGEKGEICLKGELVMIGYLNKPEATAEAIKDDWLHTGDLGYMDEEGYIFFMGRLKEMINRGGENIYPREIEVPLEAHPKIAQVAVVGKPDPDLGERVKACIILQEGEQVNLRLPSLFWRNPWKRPKS